MSTTRKKPRKYDGAITATRLRCVRVERYNKQTKEWDLAWDDLHEAYQQANRLVHVGTRHAFDLLADLYEQGKETTFKGDSPDSLYRIQKEDLEPLLKPMYHAMRRASLACKRPITSGHVNTLSQDLFKKEFSDGKNKTKLSDIVHAKRGFPVPKNLGLPIRPADWWLQVDDRTLPSGKVIQFPVIYIVSLFPKTPHVRLVCSPPRGRGSGSIWSIIKALKDIPKGPKTWIDDDGYKRGTMTIKRKKRPQDAAAKWYCVVAYGSPKVEAAEERDCMLFVHRGVAHAVMAAVVTPDGISFHPYYGQDIVQHKAQMRARKKRYQRDMGPRGNGRGKRRRFRPLRSLGDKEQRATQTFLWRIARHLQTIAEGAGASTAVIENMGTFRCDAKDDKDKAIPPYIRNWPYADLKGKIKDAMTRRAGITVNEVPAHYISQTCPCCGHTAKDNVSKLPRVFASEEWKGGVFRCELCRFTRDLDEVALLNMMDGTEIDWVKEAVMKHIKDMKKWRQEPADDLDDEFSRSTQAPAA